MKKSSFSLLVVSALVVVMGSSVFGGGKKKAKPPEHHDILISSVAGNAVTVTEGKVTRAFKITQFTEINVNGQKATIADLKPGMTVSVTIGVDPSQASRVNASGVPVDHGKKRK